MTYNHRVRFVAITVLSFSVTIALMTSLKTFSYPLLFAIAVVEFIVIFEIITHGVHNPLWLDRLHELILVGLLGITVITAWYVLQVLPVDVV